MTYEDLVALRENGTDISSADMDTVDNVIEFLATNRLPPRVFGAMLIQYVGENTEFWATVFNEMGSEHVNALQAHIDATA